MIVKNFESLRIWLSHRLKPICDADPAALAKYVMALLRKDKPDDELKSTMHSQLDVFLQTDTTEFVNNLFDVLESGDYLTFKPPPEKEDEKMEEEVEILKPMELPLEDFITSPPKSDLLNLSVGSTGSQSPLSVSREISKNASFLIDVTSRGSSLLNSSSSSLSIVGSNSGLFGVNSSAGGPMTLSNMSDSFSGADSELSIHSAPAGLLDRPKKDRNKDDEKDVRDVRSRRRSRSRDRRRSRSPRDRDRNERDRDRGRHRQRKPSPRRYERDTWDRRLSPGQGRYRRGYIKSRSRSPNKSPDRSRTPPRTEKPIEVKPKESEEKMNTTEPKAFLPSVIVRTGVDKEKAANYTGTLGLRCKDFDEKGLCMRGELCPYDHGIDPVVLEDLTMQTGTGQRINPGYTASGIQQHYTPVIRPGFIPGMMGNTHVDTQPHPVPPPMGWGHHTGFRPRMPTGQIECQLPVGGGMRGGRGGMVPRGPPAGGFQVHQRELINVPVMGAGGGGSSSAERLVDPRANLHHNTGMHMGVIGRGRGGRGRGFDHGRLGGKKNFLNSSLEVKRIPREQNNIMDLNSHFLRFGKILNIQINFEGDPEAALITFSSPPEALAAYRSTDAVLNNRFIRVFWHNKEKENEEGSSGNEASQKLFSKERLSQESSDSDKEQEKILVSGNNLTKTVYNPSMLYKKPDVAVANEKVQAMAAIKKSQESLAAQENLKKEAEKKLSEALKLKGDLELRKRNMLKEQIEQQKKLIAKLETNRTTMKAEEKENLMRLIKTLQESIEMMKKTVDESSCPPPKLKPTPKTKEETQKEMLDAELDLYQREQEGGDTHALEQKVDELRTQATLLGYFPRGGGAASRGLMRGYPRGRGRGRMQSLRTVDRRPTKIRVSGFQVQKLQEVITHFGQYGYVRMLDKDLKVPCLTLEYETRKHAEMAMKNGHTMGDTNFKLSWVQNIGGGKPVPDDGHEDHDPDNGGMDEDELGDILADEILFQYEEDEEDEEDRSWRR